MRLQKGFTLIELMVVIVIIGILVAVALPNFVGATDRARVATIKSNVHNVQTALEAYNIDKGNYPVYSGDFESDSDARNNIRRMVNPFYAGSTSAKAMTSNTMFFCHGTGNNCESGKGSMVLISLINNAQYNFLKSGAMAAQLYNGTIVYYAMSASLTSWAGTSTSNQASIKRPVVGYGLFGMDAGNDVIRGTLIQQGTPIP